MAIASFRSKGLKELFQNGRTAKIGSRFTRRAIELLDLIEAGADLKDFAGVADFHPLKHDRAGTYSMHVNGNWCITFRFEDGDAYDLDFEDYH
ncbi:MAG: type II toxin-antitoxin system RelE/ParE family toxin [Rhodospirillales bacterium]|nr:type II toxin-antitoxin system RelE/ParE family toxin [Rhodospirillales bacterium]